jgi:exonuclease 3'-5' domain-containing protein 2
VHLYATLNHHRQQLDPCPPLPYHAELNLPIRLGAGVEVADPNDAAEGDSLALINECDPAVAVELVNTDDKRNTKSLIPKAKPVPTTPIKKRPARPKDSRVEIVDDKVASYRASRTEARSKPAELRSYFLWHSYDLSPEAIAQLLRDPPLQTATVAQYILSVVQAENLPADRNRLREVADFLPASRVRSKWPVVARMIAAAAAATSH